MRGKYVEKIYIVRARLCAFSEFLTNCSPKQGNKASKQKEKSDTTVEPLQKTFNDLMHHRIAPTLVHGIIERKKPNVD